MAEAAREIKRTTRIKKEPPSADSFRGSQAHCGHPEGRNAMLGRPEKESS
jgi:hypothetical protein